jgi:hypothetical protein
MTFIKHPEHGNKHVNADEATALVREGWVIWPRSKEAKAGIVPPVVEQPEAIKRRPGRPSRKEV